MIWNVLERLTEQEVREKIGEHFERFVEEAFQIVRWSIIVGFAQFLAIRYPGHIFEALYVFLAFLLFGYVASRFLLRPEIRIFPKNASRRQRIVQSAINFLLCVIAVIAVLWGIRAVVFGLTEYRLTL
ncbi:Kef-type K+ transport system membrane component KefB [Labrenzia sp. MBR-25]|jgi:Kef-type K+ transport system membrane component KefB